MFSEFFQDLHIIYKLYIYNYTKNIFILYDGPRKATHTELTSTALHLKLQIMS